MIDIKPPQESDRAAVIGLMRISFNVAPAWERLVAPRISLERMLCAFDDGRLVAMAQDWQLRQWFGGAAQDMAGIAAVASAPERRGSGLAPEVLRAILKRCRSEGTAVSSLYPSRAAVYRRLGYEYAGILTQYRMPIGELPHSKAAGVEEMTQDDLPEMQACYRRYAARITGMVDSDEEYWWRMRIVRGWNPDVASRADGTANRVAQQHRRAVRDAHAYGDERILGDDDVRFRSGPAGVLSSPLHCGMNAMDLLD